MSISSNNSNDLWQQNLHDMQRLQNQPWYGPPNPTPPQPPREYEKGRLTYGEVPFNTTAVRMISMRLHLGSKPMPFPFLAAHQAQDKVFVFVVHADQAVTLEDDPGLFPSDKLITSLRMMLS